MDGGDQFNHNNPEHLWYRKKNPENCSPPPYLKPPKNQEAFPGFFKNYPLHLIRSLKHCHQHQK